MTDAPSIDALRAACAAAPGQAAPLIALVRALLAARRAAEAVVPAEQAAALAPGDAAAQTLRSDVHAAIAAGDPALVALELGAALAPGDAAAQLALGEAYALADRPHDAERLFKAALALGARRAAHASLSALYLSVSMADAAAHHAGAALSEADSGPDRGEADDGAVVMARQTLAAIAEAAGDGEGAARHLDAAYERRSLFVQPAQGSPFTTLVLATRETGNVPYQWLLPAGRYARLVWYMEHARLEQAEAMPPYAVVLNAIGEPDVAPASRGVVDAFLATCGLPVLNRPDQVAATARDRLPDTLAGIAGVVAPRTVRLTAARLAEAGVAGAVAAAGMAAPVLIRPIASHGGVGLALAADAAALAGIAAPAGEAYATAFVDYRSADGFYRKYRAIFVGGAAFPYHLAISAHWMVHHQSADMAGDPARKAEEMAWLADPAGAVGEGAWAAVAAIGQRLGLDYAGLDFSVLADGRVLVFEANATMLTHLEPSDGPFAAKNPYVAEIIAAFQALIAAKAGVSGDRVAG
jgi:glutathione synthase/RimK-type ligase-like ATP-grasp enzyme/tetratricopeptide (TPR) repeat protein